MKVKLTHISLIIIVIIAGIMLYITHYANKNDTIAEEAAGESYHGYSTVLEEMGLISPQQALQDYKQLSIYPPNSRPLSKENIDLLMPNRRYEQPLPIEEGSDIYYLFTADKYRVVGDDTITFVLIVV